MGKFIVDELLGRGVYLYLDELFFEFPQIEEIGQVTQEITLSAKAGHGFAVNKYVDPYEDIFTDDDFDVKKLSPMISTPEQFYHDFLRKFVIQTYPIGFNIREDLTWMTRLLKARVDGRTVKFSLDDVMQVDSSKNGKFTWKIFSGLEFKVKASIQYGGEITEYTPEDEKKMKVAWAKEFQPAP